MTGVTSKPHRKVHLDPRHLKNVLNLLGSGEKSRARQAKIAADASSTTRGQINETEERFGSNDFKDPDWLDGLMAASAPDRSSAAHTGGTTADLINEAEERFGSGDFSAEEFQLYVRGIQRRAFKEALTRGLREAGASEEDLREIEANPDWLNELTDAHAPGWSSTAGMAPAKGLFAQVTGVANNPGVGAASDLVMGAIPGLQAATSVNDQLALLNLVANNRSIDPRALRAALMSAAEREWDRGADFLRRQTGNNNYYPENPYARSAASARTQAAPVYRESPPTPEQLDGSASSFRASQGLSTALSPGVGGLHALLGSGIQAASGNFRDAGAELQRQSNATNVARAVLDRLGQFARGDTTVGRGLRRLADLSRSAYAVPAATQPARSLLGRAAGVGGRALGFLGRRVLPAADLGLSSAQALSRILHGFGVLGSDEEYSKEYGDERNRYLLEGRTGGADLGGVLDAFFNTGWTGAGAQARLRGHPDSQEARAFDVSPEWMDYLLHGEEVETGKGPRTRMDIARSEILRRYSPHEGYDLSPDAREVLARRYALSLLSATDPRVRAALASRPAHFSEGVNDPGLDQVAFGWDSADQPAIINEHGRRYVVNRAGERIYYDQGKQYGPEVVRLAPREANVDRVIELTMNVNPEFAQAYPLLTAEQQNTIRAFVRDYGSVPAAVSGLTPEDQAQLMYGPAKPGVDLAPGPRSPRWREQLETSGSTTSAAPRPPHPGRPKRSTEGWVARWGERLREVLPDAPATPPVQARPVAVDTATTAPAVEYNPSRPQRPWAVRREG